MSSQQQNPSQSSIFQHTQISFLDSDSKAILNGINLRLNDIDLKLTYLFELLTSKFPDHNRLAALDYSDNNSNNTVNLLLSSPSTSSTQQPTNSTDETPPLNYEMTPLVATENIPSGESEKHNNDDMKPDVSNIKEESEGEEEEVEDFCGDIEEVLFIIFSFYLLFDRTFDLTLSAVFI